MANPDEADHIQGWRAGVASRPSGPLAKFDFKPSVDAPPYLQEENIIGEHAPAKFNGLPVLGSYGPAFLIESNFIPSGYVGVVSTNGPNSLSNAIAVRTNTDGTMNVLLLITDIPTAPTMACERAMSVRANVIVDVRACSPDIGNAGLTIARDIAAKVTGTQ